MAPQRHTADIERCNHTDGASILRGKSNAMAAKPRSRNTCRNRPIACPDCGCKAWQTRSWMLRGMLTCSCGCPMMPTKPADLAFVGLVTSADMSQAAWNAICRENGWDLTRNQGQASRRLSEPVIHAPTKPQCSYAGCGRWVAAGVEHCHEHSPALEAAIPF